MAQQNAKYVIKSVRSYTSIILKENIWTGRILYQEYDKAFEDNCPKDKNYLL